ncbi:ATP-dependent nuclease [Mycolicibacterium sp.]|uniref:ATP-dependent nuclease n=1 Tax=Mycolicibacterium sp. TaxID=2320850 RepID=UPI003D0AFC24
MKLVSARIQNYRCVEDSESFELDEKVTCLVGKNESGKTALLQALHLLNPLNPIKGKVSFNEVMDYPSRHHSAYKRRANKDIEANVLTAKFVLEDRDIRRIEADFGENFLEDKYVTVSRGYAGSKTYSWQYDEAAALRHRLSDLELSTKVKASVAKAETFADAVEILKGVEEPHSSVTTFIDQVSGWRKQRFALHFIDDYLDKMLPKFFYFDDYSVMRGKVSLPFLKARQEGGTLDESDNTFLSLLATVEADLDSFETADYEELVRELEGAANGITDDVMRFWTQNPDLQVEIQISNANPADDPPLNQGPIVHVRIRNPRHRVTVPFDERSRGFVWFFSFFAYFSNLEHKEDRSLVLLLDEPGLNLHATAQGDFLAFIENRLAGEKNHQVIYSTHSPFLIDAAQLDRVRTVQDVDGEGTKVGADALRTDRDTVFPLQGALGYDLAQTLFVGPECLLVEGPSDLLYLQLLSQACEASGRSTLDERWTVTPVGGADKLSTFISLLGSNQLNIVALMDTSSKDKARVQNLQENGYLGKRNLVLMSEFTGEKDSDTEDIFTPSFFLELVSGAYGSGLSKPLKVSDLSMRGGRIVARVERHFVENNIAAGKFSHYRPAAFFLREQVRLLPKISDVTLDRASALFDRINALLK